MFDKLQTIETRYDKLMALVSDAAVQADPKRYRTHAKALTEIQPIVETFREYKTVVAEIAQTRELREGNDADMRELAEQELATLETRRNDLLAEIKVLMVPKDPNDEKNIVLEIRAGTGGDEAGLFAGELFRMYTRFADRQGWKVDVLSTSESGVGAIKEGILRLGAVGADMLTDLGLVEDLGVVESLRFPVVHRLAHLRNRHFGKVRHLNKFTVVRGALEPL